MLDDKGIGSIIGIIVVLAYVKATNLRNTLSMMRKAALVI